MEGLAAWVKKLISMVEFLILPKNFDCHKKELTMRYVKGILPIFMIFLFLGCGSQDEPDSAVKDPQTPADFVEQASFTTLQGDSVHISDYRGKVVLIDFWETWCKPCLGSFPGIDSLKQAYPDDFVVLAVTPGFTDSVEDARKFAESHDYDFTYLMDTYGLHKSLNVRGIPFKVFVGADGEFVKSSLGSAGPRGDYTKIREVIQTHRDSTGSTSR